MPAQLTSVFRQGSAARIPVRSLPMIQEPIVSSVDLRRWMSPVSDQADLGSCGANAYAAILEYLIQRQYRKTKSVSRLFIYYNARKLVTRESRVKDSGCFLTSTAQALVLYGACEENLWPYESELVNVRPSEEAFQAAKQYSARPVKVPIEKTAICTSLAYGCPVVVGITLSRTAGQEARKRNGYISVPVINATTVRNSQMHAIVICGYDDKKQIFIVRNSWGRDWGLNGYFYLPYDYIVHDRLVSWTDGAWTIEKIVNRKQDLPSLRIARFTGQESANKKKKHFYRKYLR